MDTLPFLLLLLTWRVVACENNSTYSEVNEEDNEDSYMPQKSNEDAQYDSGWVPMASADSESKLPASYESSSSKSSAVKTGDGSTENNIPLLDGILPFGNHLFQQGSTSYTPSSAYKAIVPSQVGSFNYFPAATANVPLGYSLSFGQSIPTYGTGSAASYPVTQQRENNIYSGTNLVANIQASPDYSKGTNQIVTGTYKNLIPKTTEHRVKVTTQDFASPFFKNSAYYGNAYSPATQKLTVSDPSGYIFGGNLPISYNFNPTASFSSLQQGAPSSLTTNTTNSQYAQYPFVNVAATSPISLGNLPAYSGQVLSANSFPGFTGQQVLSPYQFSPNNIFKNTVAPTSFSSGIYHNQPVLQTNQQIQQYPLTQPYIHNSGLNTYSNQNKQQSNVQGHLGPQTYPVTTSPNKYTKPVSYVKNSQQPTRFNYYSSTEKPTSNYKPSSNYKSNYYDSGKYKTDDDSKGYSPYKSDDDDDEEEDSERYTSSQHDDYHDDDNKGNYEEPFDSSNFPSASNFFKNSRPFEKNFFNDHDSDSTSTYPRSPKPTAPRYSDKKYNDEPYRSSTSYSERGRKYNDEDDDHHRHSSNSPSSRYQSSSRPDSKKKSDEEDVPTLFRPYKYKPPSYADERSTEFLGKPGPVKVTYRDKYYEEIKMKEKDRDSDGEHSEQNPQSIKSATTTEDKKSDYYSYTFTKQKIMQ